MLKKILFSILCLLPLLIPFTADFSVSAEITVEDIRRYREQLAQEEREQIENGRRYADQQNDDRSDYTIYLEEINLLFTFPENWEIQHIESFDSTDPSDCICLKALSESGLCAGIAILQNDESLLEHDMRFAENPTVTLTQWITSASDSVKISNISDQSFSDVEFLQFQGTISDAHSDNPTLNFSTFATIQEGYFLSIGFFATQDIWEETMPEATCNLMKNGIIPFEAELLTSKSSGNPSSSKISDAVINPSRNADLTTNNLFRSLIGPILLLLAGGSIVLVLVRVQIRRTLKNAGLIPGKLNTGENKVQKTLSDPPYSNSQSEIEPILTPANFTPSSTSPCSCRWLHFYSTFFCSAIGVFNLFGGLLTLFTRLNNPYDLLSALYLIILGILAFRTGFCIKRRPNKNTILLQSVLSAYFLSTIAMFFSTTLTGLFPSLHTFLAIPISLITAFLIITLPNALYFWKRLELFSKSSSCFPSFILLRLLLALGIIILYLILSVLFLFL